MGKLHEAILNTLQTKKFSSRIHLTGNMPMPENFQVEKQVCRDDRIEAMTNWTPFTVRSSDGAIIRNRYYWRLIFTVEHVTKTIGSEKFDILQSTVLADVGKKHLCIRSRLNRRESRKLVLVK